MPKKKHLKLWLCIIGVALILLALITPPVYLLKYGKITYYPYEADGQKRFTRTIGPKLGQGTWVNEHSITSGCAASFILAEDKAFMSHSGVSWQKFLITLKKYLTSNHISGSSSTITQQLIKNLFLSRDKTVTRKAREVLGALLVEQIMSKTEILTWYFNTIEYGPSVYGIGHAAQFYFNKEPNELSSADCAKISSILTDPINLHTQINSSTQSEKVLERYWFNTYLLESIGLMD